MNARSWTLVAGLFAVGSRAMAQEPKSPPPVLRDEIAAADSALFTAFNQRDLTKVMSYFSRDLEFYHDNEGVASYAQTQKDFGQMFGQAAPIRRELVAGSLEVFPVKN
jgi:hypothetical protein